MSRFVLRDAWCLAGAGLLGFGGGAVPWGDASVALAPQDAAPLSAIKAAAYRDDLAQVWFLCGDGDEPYVRVFDAALREGQRLSAAAWPAGAGDRADARVGVRPAADGTLTLPAWGGRALHLDGAGRLRLGAHFWESAPRIEWGPGWAAVELRCARPVTALRWRLAGAEGAESTVAFRSDRHDGIRQRAHLRGLAAGAEIEILLPEALPTFPPRAEKWERFRVPEVDPAGTRPTSEWPGS